jgi:FkbM family methyltransferase
MKLVAILRIKNQIQTIDECMEKLTELVDEIVVLDNGSTDGTSEAYKKYSKITKILNTVGFDEGRDKIMLLEEAKKTNPDWILWIDADEVFEKHLTREVLESYMRSKHNRIVFRMCNFWLSRERCRYDSEYYLYTLHPQRSMWRNVESAYFKNLVIHNGDIQGVPGKPFLSPYRIKHYGYVYKDKILEKMRIYSDADKDRGRDYKSTIDPELKFKSFKFHEYNNKFLNYIYIIFYKYILNVLWIAERMRLKIKKLRGWIYPVYDKLKVIFKIYVMRDKFFAVRYKFKKDDAKHGLRYNYSLDENSLVLDFGGYTGEWAERIWNRYKCRIYIFEPVREFYNQAVQRFSRNRKIKIFNFGLSNINKEDLISIDGVASSVFSKNRSVKIQLRDVKEVFNELGITNVGLLKINIEGGEFQVLPRMLDANLIPICEDIQIEFHKFYPNSEILRNTIQERLSITHHITYDYPFFFENWKRNDSL